MPRFVPVALASRDGAPPHSRGSPPCRRARAPHREPPRRPGRRRHRRPRRPRRHRPRPRRRQRGAQPRDARPTAGLRRRRPHRHRQAGTAPPATASAARPAGLSLAAFDAGRLLDDRELAEKIIRKLRAKMMPPAGAKRPDGTALADMAGGLRGAGSTPRRRGTPAPGSRSFQRLNRAEYARAVKDLLALDIDVTALLPADTISQGFDNVADAQTFSPALMESYLRAAGRVAALALGDRDAEAERGALPRAQDRVAAAARRRRAVRHPRRHLGDAHLPGRRRVRLPRRPARQRLRVPVRRARPPTSRSRSRSTASAARCWRSTRRCTRARPASTLKSPADSRAGRRRTA